MMSEQPKDQRPGTTGMASDLDARLEGFFAAARQEAGDRLPDALQARLLGDALTRIPPLAQASVARGRANGLWRRLADWSADLGRAIGGTPGLAAVSAAGLAGVWIGIAAPGPAAELVGYVWQGAVAVDAGAAGQIDDALGLSDDGALLALMDSD